MIECNQTTELWWRNFMMEHAQSTGMPSSNDMRTKIQSWLIQQRWSIRAVSAPETQWVLICEDEGQRKVVLVQPSKIENQVAIQGAVKIEEPAKSLFSALSPDKRDEFVWELRFALLSMGVGQDGVKEPLELIKVNQVIHYDGFTQDAFWQRVLLVRNALVTIQWMIARRFAQPPIKPPPLGFPTPTEDL